MNLANTLYTLIMIIVTNNQTITKIGEKWSKYIGMSENIIVAKQINGTNFLLSKEPLTIGKKNVYKLITNFVLNIMIIN